MAGEPRSFVVPAGGENSESDDDDGWQIGFVSEAPPKKEHLDETLQVDDKDVAFKKALTMRNASMVEELLNSGVSVESTFEFGWTPLMYTASVVDVVLMRILLDRGANASFDKDQYTVLMAACTAHASEEQILKSVELLLSRNANPNASCKKKMTPLMYAAREGHPQVVALLAAHGSQINVQDENGYTALTWAAHQGHKKVVFKLLELGADKSIQTKDGQTPGGIAKNRRHLELFSLLSLTTYPFQRKFQNLTKEEAVHGLLKAVPDAGNKIRSYSAFGDLEVFLHGLGLEHVTEILKERGIVLKELLGMGKEDLLQIGIKNARDQQKIQNAAKELQGEVVKLGNLSGVMSLEFSADEFLTFLLKLNKQCVYLTTAVHGVVNQFPTDSHKLVLQWHSSQSLMKVCEDIVSSVEDLNGEVSKLKKLTQKLREGEKDHPCLIQPPRTKSRWKNTFLKIAVLTLAGSGCVFLISKFTLRKS